MCGDGGPNIRRSRKYSGSGRSSVINGPSPATRATWSPEIQTSDAIRLAQPAASCSGESYADDRSSVTPGRARIAPTFAGSSSSGASEPSMYRP